MKRIATVVTAGALALVAGSLVMLEASDQAAAFVGGGGHAVGGGRTMSRSVGRPATRPVNARRATTVSRGVSTGGTTPHFSSITSRRVNTGTMRVTSTTIRKPRISKSVSTANVRNVNTGTERVTSTTIRKPRIGSSVSTAKVSKPGIGRPTLVVGPGGIRQGPGNTLATPKPFLATPDSGNVPSGVTQKPIGAAGSTLGHFNGDTIPGDIKPGAHLRQTQKPSGGAGSTPGLGTPSNPPGPNVGPQVGGANPPPGGAPKLPTTVAGPPTPVAGTGAGQPPPGNVKITIINNRYVNVFGGPRRIWWAGAWVSLAAPAVIPGVWDGGIQYEPRGYVALAKPVCSGVTPEGYRLTWRDVPTDTGVVIPQCVAYYPRGRAAPAVAVGAVPGQAVCAAAQFGETERGWLGVRIQQVTDEIADSLNISPPRGALVAGVDDRGPAKPAGIEPGDVIVKFDGKDIKEMRDLPHVVADTPVGKQTPVVFIRKGKEETKTVTLGRLGDGKKLAAADPKCEGTPEPVASAMAQGCLVEIYSQVAFTGTSSDVVADQPRLSEYGWDKQISSLNVKSGTWDFYSEPDYGGPVVRLPPGQYANLEGWDKQISSFMCTQAE